VPKCKLLFFIVLNMSSFVPKKSSRGILLHYFIHFLFFGDVHLSNFWRSLSCFILIRWLNHFKLLISNSSQYYLLCTGSLPNHNIFNSHSFGYSFTASSPFSRLYVYFHFCIYSPYLNTTQYRFHHGSSIVFFNLSGYASVSSYHI